MGGDGGVIASNRKYLRGAGSAECTADAQRNRHRHNDREGARETMTTCAVTKAPLNFELPVVVCPYGRLYQREAALEALLRRKTDKDELGSHVRGLRDLYEAKMEFKKNNNGSLVPVCPVTGVELNGQAPAFLIQSKKEHDINVISERAVKEMGMESLQAEYGPFDKDHGMIRLAPPFSMMECIQEKLTAKRELEKLQKNKKDGKKKRKKGSPHDTTSPKSKSLKTSSNSNGSAADVARMSVKSAVASNTVLSSIFTSDKSSLSEKDKKDNLFAR